MNPRNPLIETSDSEAAELVAIAMAREPELTHFGMGVGDRRTVYRTGGPEAVKAKVAEGREQLRAALDEVAAAADWIKARPRRKTVDTAHHSYGYKHRVESWLRGRGADLYVANGSFIAAAIGLGVAYKTWPNSPNVCFAVSRKDAL